MGNRNPLLGSFETIKLTIDIRFRIGYTGFMIQDPFTFATFPTFADIPYDYRFGFISKFRDRPGSKYRNAKKQRMLKFMWFSYFGRYCPSCGTEMTTKQTKTCRNEFATIDHILARGLGGHTTDFSNLTCICRGCNGSKSAYESKIGLVLAAA